MPNMHFKSQIYKIYFTTDSSAKRPAKLPACLPAVRPGSTMARAPIFSHNKGNCIVFTKLLF